MENIKIVIWGFGAMGAGMAAMLNKKKGVDIVGVCDLHPERAGKSVAEVLEIDRWNDVIISKDIDAVLSAEKVDLCLLATDSFTKGAYPKLKMIMEKGINVITTAEEMAYPKAQEPVLASELHEIAKANGVTVLGTGINPGMIMTCWLFV